MRGGQTKTSKGKQERMSEVREDGKQRQARAKTSKSVQGQAREDE